MEEQLLSVCPVLSFCPACCAARWLEASAPDNKSLQPQCCCCHSYDPSHSRLLFPHRSEVPRSVDQQSFVTCGGLREDPLLGFSSSGDLSPSFLFIEWVRFPGQRRRGPSFILHWLRGTCSVHRDSCGHFALLGRPEGGMKDQCSKGLKCSLRRLEAESVQSAQSDWVVALFGSVSQSLCGDDIQPEMYW